MAAGSATVDEPLLTIPRSPRFWRSPFGWSFALATGVAFVCAALLVASHLREPVVPTTTVKGIMASKRDFFRDERVRRLLADHHIEVEVTPRGSRDVAREVVAQETDRYDFTFPSGQPAADLIKNERGDADRYYKTTKLFSSPLVLATFRPYAETLVARGVATRHDTRSGKPLYYTLDTAAFVRLGEQQRTWNDIGFDEYATESGERLSSRNQVLAHTPGVCRSNSGATYLGLVAFVKNGHRAPGSEAEVDRLARQIEPLVTATGMPEEELFGSYVTDDGTGTGPVVVYEHQYLAYQLDHTARTGHPDEERVLLYPEQEFQTDPELIVLRRGAGDRLAELLDTDPELRRRMMELGYRVHDDTDQLGTRQLFQFLRDRGVPPPDDRTDLTSATFPTLPLLERLIDAVGGCRR